MRFRIERRTTRGDQPEGTHVVHPIVKVGKVQRLLDECVCDTIRHEGSAERVARVTYTEDRFGYHGATIEVGISTFIINATPIGRD